MADTESLTSLVQKILYTFIATIRADHGSSFIEAIKTTSVGKTCVRRSVSTQHSFCACAASVYLARSTVCGATFPYPETVFFAVERGDFD